MSAPTEAEIRATLHAHWTRPRDSRLSLADEFSDAFGAACSVVDGLWDTDNFRPAEEDRYDALVSAAGTMVWRGAEARLLEVLITALATFAAEHPDAPRA